MRSETPFLCSFNPDPIRFESTVQSNWIEYRDVEPTQRASRFAVEVCWVVADAVTCRTYQVRASNETRAAGIACHRASENLDESTAYIEAVDIERIERGCGHE